MRIAFALLTAPLLAAGNPRVEYAMGFRARLLGDEGEMIRHLEKAHALDPRALPPVMKLVEVRMEQEDRDGALQLLRELAVASPDRVDVQLEYSAFLEREGRGDAMAQKVAVEVLENVLAKRPGRLDVTSRLLNIFRERGEREKALPLLESLPEGNPDAARMYASASQALFNSDDKEAAARVDARYGKALAADPEDPDLARAVSDHFLDTGRLERAVSVLEDHVKAAPWSLDLRTRLGVLFFSAKRDAEGKAALEEVITIRPESVLAHQALAKHYRLKGEEKPERYHSAELLKIRSGSPKEFSLLATGFLEADEPRAARLLLEKGVFDHPDRPELAMKLAVATRRDPETRARASRLFREAEAAMGPDFKPDEAFLIESADCLIEEGKTKAAEERLRSAIRSYGPERKKETAVALRRLAGLWESEKRNEEAARSLRQRADSLDPP